MISHKTNKDCINLVQTWCIANYDNKAELVVVKKKTNNKIQIELELYNGIIPYNIVITKTIDELKNEIYTKIEKLVC